MELPLTKKKPKKRFRVNVQLYFLEKKKEKKFDFADFIFDLFSN